MSRLSSIRLKLPFTGEESALKVAYFRILLGLTVFLTSALLAPLITDYCTTIGVPASELAAQASTTSTPSIFFILATPVFVWSMYAVLLLSLVLFILGVLPRISGLVAYVLFLSFMIKVPWVRFGGTDLMQNLLILVVFMQSGAALSLWSGMPKKHTVPAWPIELAKFQVALVYFFSGYNKLSEPSWANGQYMLHALTDVNFSYFNFSWLTHQPLLVALLTYAVLFIELAAPIALYIPYLRRTALILLLGLTAGFMVFLNVHTFPEIMFTACFLFLSSEEVAWIHGHISRLFRHAANRFTMRNFSRSHNA